MFRKLAVFPGPFTLEAAETVAGPQAGPAVLHLVDCSLLVPPRTGPDGRFRYLMLQTLPSMSDRRFHQRPGWATQIIQFCAYDRSTSHRPSLAVSRFTCRPIETKVMALRRMIPLAWAMPMTGSSGLRWRD